MCYSLLKPHHSFVYALLKYKHVSSKSFRASFTICFRHFCQTIQYILLVLIALVKISLQINHSKFGIPFYIHNGLSLSSAGLSKRGTQLPSLWRAPIRYRAEQIKE